MKYLHTILKSLSLAIGFFLFLIVPIGQVKGEVETEFIKNDVLQMETVADDYEEILDYKNTNACIEYDKENLKCITTTPSITYLSVEKDKLINEFENENIDKRTLNTIVFNNNTYRVYAGQPFYKENNNWFETKTVTVTKDNWNAIIEYKTTKPTIDELISINNPLKIYSVNAQTVYSGSGDGSILAYSASAWPAVVNITTGDSVDYTSSNAQFQAHTNYIRRIFLPFDTSAIPDTSTISTTTLTIFLDTGGNGSLGDNQLYVCEASQENSDSLVTTDYDNINKSNLFSSVITLSATTTIDFNSNGISAINKTGFSKIGIIHELDYSEVSPGAGNLYQFIKMSEYAGTINDPFLEITAIAGEEETPVATTTIDLFACQVPENTLIQRITGCKNIYGTSSTSSPEYVEYFYIDIPMALLIFIYLLIGLGLSIVFIFIFINKKK